jgi:hypothetical protein
MVELKVKILLWISDNDDDHSWNIAMVWCPY